MDPQSLSRPLQLLRICVHLLMFALLALAAGRAVVDHDAGAPTVIIAAAFVAVVYAFGPALPPVRRSPVAAAAWLVLLTAAWGVLLWRTPDAAWIAFPLFLLQLHLLRASWGPVAVAVTTAAAILGTIWHRGFQTAAVIGPVIGAAVAVATVLGYQALYRESERRSRLIEQLTATRADLAAAEHAAGVLAERERLAREIHDTLAQGLSSIQLLLRAAQRELPVDPAGAAGHLEHARRTAQDNLAEARRFVRALAPPDLVGGSLPAALERLCAQTSERSPVTVRLHLDGQRAELPTPLEVALLRIAQSALANTVRHSGATRADVTLTYMESRVALDVVDDGGGFDVGALPATAHETGGFGLAAMRARSSELGGTMSVESAPGQGSALSVSFPLTAGEACSTP